MFNTIHRSSSKPCNKSQHSCPGIHISAPDKGIVRDTDPGKIGEEERLSVRTGDTLNKYGHLFILPVQASLEPICECIFIHGAREDPADTLAELPVSLFGRPLVDAENAFILSGKG